MTIIATAPVPRSIDRETTHQFATISAEIIEKHPAWCINADIYTTHGINLPCGDHLGEPSNIPATDGDFEVTDRGALFPRVEVAAATKGDQSAVNVVLFNPVDGDGYAWVGVHMYPTDARKLAADLHPLEGAPAADRAGVKLTAAADALDGVVSAVTDGGSVRLALVDSAKKLYLSAFLKPSEIALVSFALVRAADEVEGR